MENNKPKSLFEQMGGTYTLGEDGIYYPDLILTEDEPHYGKYGRMRKKFLEQHRPVTFSTLVLKSKLVAHLNEIDDACMDYMERTVEAMAKAEGVTEELKSTDFMEWLRRMNSIHSRAEEGAIHDFIYDGE